MKILIVSMIMKKPVNSLKKEHFFSKLKMVILMMKKFKELWILLKGSILKMGKN